ncbi:ATP-binding protein [Candidatus Woesearchaeota archaeon]|nr:ATP-binding protein [Candidatus Woesearchaeota archaeon]
MYEIVIGRSAKDKEKLGLKGTIFLGKHYVKMGSTTSLSNEVYLDVSRSHVVFVCGKRGGGKSYTMGVIAEGMANLPENIRKNLSFVVLDTMGIYWTMKFPNKKDKELLDEWGLDSKPLDVKIYTPTGYFNEFKEKGIPTDFPFSIKPSELDSREWAQTFGISPTEPIGVLVERIIHELKEKTDDYSVDDIISAIKSDKTSKKETRDAAINRFLNTKNWGLFDTKGTKLSDIVKGGQVTVLDVSCYATLPGGWDIKNLVVGLVSQKLFIDRMVARRDEEFRDIHSQMNYFYDEDEPKEMDDPMVWLVIDEAHEFLPNQGKTLATDPLVTILREGRQPGISLILASQQPGKIHTDVMTQADIIISHRITAKIDTDALGSLTQSYMREGLDKYLNELPHVNGSAIILDDNNEKVFPIKVRPRFTWHGGEAPVAVKTEKKIFEF